MIPDYCDFELHYQEPIPQGYQDWRLWGTEGILGMGILARQARV
ncbi:MAG: hypothetical protein PVH37_11620 [Desulfobacterales bacterium]